MPPLASLGIIFATYVLTLGLTVYVRKVLLKRAVLDEPN